MYVLPPVVADFPPKVCVKPSGFQFIMRRFKALESAISGFKYKI